MQPAIPMRRDGFSTKTVNGAFRHARPHATYHVHVHECRPTDNLSLTVFYEKFSGLMGSVCAATVTASERFVRHGRDTPPPLTRGISVNQDIIQGKWKQLKGSIRNQWGKLTDDDLDRLDGNQQYLSGKLQERYGWAKETADEEIRRFERTLN
jgi:uncharacterized protein YjbJ (UPF0337 family)